MKKTYMISTALIVGAFGIAVNAVSFASASEEAGQRFEGNVIVADDFVGTLIIQTGNFESISATVQIGSAVGEGDLRAPVLKQKPNGLFIQGDERAKVRNCSEAKRIEDQTVQIKGKSKRPLSDFPVLRVTAPKDIEIDLQLDGGRMQVGEVALAKTQISGCGDILIGDVAEKLRASITGSGNIMTGHLGELDASLYGSGDMRFGDVVGEAELSISGSGDISTGMIGGEAEISIAGSGGVRSKGGSGSLDVSIAGSGEVDFIDALFENLDVSIAGSGDVRVFGDVGDVDVSILGSGDLNVSDVTGTVSIRQIGSGDIHVNGHKWTKKGWEKD